jgi:small-conductance mechanosensitive channel
LKEFNQEVLNDCLKELEVVKTGIQQKDEREKYFKVSQKYQDLKKHKTDMKNAHSQHKIYNFSELDEQNQLLQKKNEFFDNYLKKGTESNPKNFLKSKKQKNS